MKLVIPEHVQWSEDDGKMVLLDCKANRYYAVSQSAAIFLKEIQRNGDMERVVQYVSERYQEPLQKVNQDMGVFIKELYQRGLLIQK
ncbi:PqqD family protein [Hazenella sp. IB182357]|uniref:PqqD family protein n=1 Tax=Polycladospora coralii TaxID=2771432 RepID=A0A926RTH7_9BACL|nr:PqqD family protein [Polycladospora coralii]MBD1372840.1 PqqD family protein [Polycladospora coralii]